MTLGGKQPLKMLLSSFSVGLRLLGKPPTLKCCFPSETPLEETKVSFASGYQLEITSGLGMRSCIHFYQL